MPLPKPFVLQTHTVPGFRLGPDLLRVFDSSEGERRRKIGGLQTRSPEGEYRRESHYLSIGDTTISLDSVAPPHVYRLPCECEYNRTSGYFGVNLHPPLASSS